MNYLLQVNAFWRLQDEMELKTPMVALWFSLMNINNGLAWKNTFIKPSSFLRGTIGISERGFFEARNALVQKGLITVKSRGGNRAPIYHIVNLYEELPAYNADKPTDKLADKHADSLADKSAVLTKEKHKDKHKTKVNKSAENDSAESDFDKLWSLYPRKEGRKTALAAYKRAVKKGATNKLIQDGIVQYSKHIEVKNTDKQYIKTGATFFSQEAWNDEFDMTPGRANSFGKVVKKESLPDWAKDDYEPPEETGTVDKAALQKQLDEFNKTSPKEK